MRHSFLVKAAAAVVAVQLYSPTTFSQSVEISGSGSANSSVAVQDTSIRPFRVAFSEEALTDLRRRIAAMRWPDKETVNDDSQGVRLATMQQLARYWATDYDWRKVEARLNTLRQFVTTIDGLDIHFIHVKSKHAHALPMIITHDWPGSVIEQLKVIGPLTDPTSYAERQKTRLMW